MSGRPEPGRLRGGYLRLTRDSRSFGVGEAMIAKPPSAKAIATVSMIINSKTFNEYVASR
jgi:hypothetical protein